MHPVDPEEGGCEWLCVSWAMTACAGWSTRSAFTASFMQWLVVTQPGREEHTESGLRMRNRVFYRAGVKIPVLFRSHVPLQNTCAGRTIPYLRELCVVFSPWFHSAHFSHIIFLCKAPHPLVLTHSGVCIPYVGIYEQSWCSGGAGGLWLLHFRALVTFRASYCPSNNLYYFKWTWAQNQQPI